MLHSESKASVNRKAMKFAVAAAAMAALAGCAIAMPLRPLMTFSQDRRDGNFACTAHSKCPNGSKQDRLAYRRSQSADRGKMGDDPPDFILTTGDQNGAVR
jgi:hypothetical protein